MFICQKHSATTHYLMIDSYGDGLEPEIQCQFMINGTVVIASETLLSGDLRIIPFTSKSR